ncbi:amino acid permease [Heliobacterium gestii]|uniref:Amino acid permease n=1 Tax=Heliomicrobium gestii TaxID=2699 RepID=A0A845L6W9_HELGE|nr:amino acid permease [Heliomicrobium gestii]MBM7868365.1 APA family basic amino acid/polyamine antiporter [Heliomicrobium gestii]MZP42427.1 amino acid permease [Heliomicrobium gestii]
MQHNSESMLKKDIGTIVAMSIVIGSVIGSGIFMKPGKVIVASGDSTMALWAWVLGGIITLASGLTIVELATQIPKTGGLYVYLEEVYGKLWGYLCGWVQTLIYGPAIIAALGLYFGSLVAHFFGWGPEAKMYVGLSAIIFLAIVNSIGTKYGGFVQTLATAGKLIPIALIAIFGIWQGDGQILNMTSGVTEKTGMAAAILATLWAYDGWLLVGFVAGEMKNPAKILPRAIIIGLSIVTVAYLSVNIAMMHVLPAAEIARLGENAAGTAATILFGGIGGKLISIGIMVSIFGCLNGKILTFPRVPLAMAERGQLPFSRLLAQVQPKLGTPIFATLSQVVIAVVMMFVADSERLSDIAIFAIYVFYIFAFVAVFLLRKKNSAASRIYSVPGYPIIPLVAIVGSVFIIVSTIFDNPTDTLFALLITVIGLPVYWVLNRKTMASANQEG